MILSHFRAGSGAVLVETREESRFLRELLAELPEGTPVCRIAAPSGQLLDARTGKQEQGLATLTSAYNWTASRPGRVLVVYDWHVLCNSPGHWRALAEILPALRCPPKPEEEPDGEAADESGSSLVVFVGPSWDMQPHNPLRGLLPMLTLAPPDRAAIRAVADGLLPLNGDAEAVIDALCGLSADAAEQAAAETLARSGGRWDLDALRDARRQAIREAGLELWPTVAELGGLSGFRGVVESEVIPWVRDEQLSVRRILCAGLPGTGKSFGSRWLAGKLRCECARLSVSGLKAGIVGASESNLRRALSTLDALGRHSPCVVVLDEIDSIARDGLDGGTSSGMFAELLTWLQESTSQCVVIATLNRLDKLDAALESRFQVRFFYDLPSPREREAVALIHYRRLNCAAPEKAANATASLTDGYSSRELAEHVIPSVARLTERKPTESVIRSVCESYTPASRTQAEQLKCMRSAAASLRRANDPETAVAPKGRRVG